MALLAALFAAVMLTCLGASLVLLGAAETTLAAHDGQAVAASHAARGAIELALSDLRRLPSWSGVVAAAGSPDVCVSTGTLIDGSLAPAAPWDASALDLHALTVRVQAATDADTPAGVAGPVWRLFEYGPISRLIPAEPRRFPFYVAVWAAGGRDGAVLLHAVALGPGGLAVGVDASVAQEPGGSAVRRLAVRGSPP